MKTLKQPPDSIPPIPRVKGQPILPKSPEESRKLIQKQLVLLLHAHACLKKDYVFPDRPVCTVPNCKMMKDVWVHIKLCRIGPTCSHLHCLSSLRILAHWKNCKDPNCPVCQLVRAKGAQQLQFQLQLQLQLKAKQMQEAQSQNFQNIQNSQSSQNFRNFQNIQNFEDSQSSQSSPINLSSGNLSGQSTMDQGQIQSDYESQCQGLQPGSGPSCYNSSTTTTTTTTTNANSYHYPYPDSAVANSANANFSNNEAMCQVSHYQHQYQHQHVAPMPISSPQNQPQDLSLSQNYYASSNQSNLSNSDYHDRKILFLNQRPHYDLFKFAKRSRYCQRGSPNCDASISNSPNGGLMSNVSNAESDQNEVENPRISPDIPYFNPQPLVPRHQFVSDIVGVGDFLRSQNFNDNGQTQKIAPVPSANDVRRAYEQLGIPCPSDALKRLMKTLPGGGQDDLDDEGDIPPCGSGGGRASGSSDSSEIDDGISSSPEGDCLDSDDGQVFSSSWCLSLVQRLIATGQGQRIVSSHAF